MKKTLIAAITLLIAFAFIACDPVEPTKEEMLKNKKGWVLTAATSVPPYIMASTDDHISDLYKNYYYDYELDDIYLYKEDGALQVDPGKLLPPAGEDGYTKVTTLGTWVLTYPKLLTKVPGFYDEETTGAPVMDRVDITELSETTLQYTYYWIVDSDPAKAPKGKRAPKTRANGKGDEPEAYTWTLTFTAK